MDKLVDIMCYLPGLCENIMSSAQKSSSVAKEHQNHAANPNQADIRRLMYRLREWREDWEQMHPHTAIVAVGKVFKRQRGGNAKEDIQGLARDLAESQIRFRALDQALEILAHHAAVLYLSRLGELTGYLQPALSYTPDELRSHLLDILHPKTPPLLPINNTVQAPWKLVIEAVRISRYITDELQGATLSELIPLFSLGIICSAAKAMPIIGDTLTATLESNFKSSIVSELAIYGIWRENDNE
jgi:hypothetical protein